MPFDNISQELLIFSCDMCGRVCCLQAAASSLIISPTPCPVLPVINLPCTSLYLHECIVRVKLYVIHPSRSRRARITKLESGSKVGL